MNSEALHPETFDSALSLRKRKETLLGQNARVIWMCGLSGAGKSTLAGLLDNELTGRGYICQIIDGDIVRGGLNKGLGFTQDDRRENLRRVAEVARLFTECGVITLVAFISPTHSIRKMVKEIVGEPDYVEVFINASLEVCENRDTKGLYKQAREGKIKEFTGIDSPFEAPENPAIRIDTGTLSIDESLHQLVDFVIPLIQGAGDEGQGRRM